MKSKSSLIVVVAVIVVVAGVAVLSKSARSSSLVQTPSVAGVMTTSPAATSVPVVSFAVEGGMYYFNPKEIRVRQGDRVKITFTNVEGMHDLVIDEFNVRSKTIQAGESDTVEFLADKKGIFEYYCSVGKHRQMGMVGSLIVD